MPSVIGIAYTNPTAPIGIKIVSAACGPYAAEPSASRPKHGKAGSGSYSLLAFFIGSHRSPEDEC